ncbi:Thioredoxin-like superfamily [Babesia duncani]|uniref:Thioredoxin-like superfamily n=1 Tax=Babesia duncani TaxID=323732 RepID=A0AAD9PHY0_9APIC|nr:Thioredoxin-like superfamily [Babesia duncani]
MFRQSHTPFRGAYSIFYPKFGNFSSPPMYRMFHALSKTNKRRTMLKTLGISLTLGAGVYLPFKMGLLKHDNIPLPMINEDSFDAIDDFVVVILTSERLEDFPKDKIEKLKSILPKGVTLYYTIRKGGDEKEFKFMLYKGMRKQYYNVADILDDNFILKVKEEMKTFFEPMSQDDTILVKAENLPEYVTLDNFEQTVINDATRKSPILLQLYEENCFLCFLMRPFINSVNRHLKQIGNPLRIKRLNIEENDFPKGCPVTRATPTFIYYDGGKNGTKWAEFKPQDFVKKLGKVANLSPCSMEYLDKLSMEISNRFILFGQLSRWLAESQIIQVTMLSGEVSDDTENDMYSRAIKMLMEIDMPRTDCLEENLKLLKQEIDSSERDCIAIAQIMAEEIIRRQG